jgi:hypothetical protein
MLRQFPGVESPQLSISSSNAPSAQRAPTVQALKATRQLLGCFRTGEANDPAIFAAAVAAVLSDYPLEIIQYVCDPRTGLPSSSKWMPTAAEVKAACEGRATWLAKIDRFENFGKKRPTYERQPTEAERKRVARMHADLKQRLERGPDDEYEARQRLKVEQNAAALKAQQGRVKREYAALGALTPPSPLALSVTCRRDMELRDAIKEPEDTHG